MATEVHTACPQCGDEIPFYQTVDELKQCPECGTPSDDLFDIAMGRMEPDGDSQRALADGGVARDE